MVKKGNHCSVGTIDGKYCFGILTGICDLLDYYPITKEEFATFEQWKDDTNKIVKDIQNRKLLCSAYKKL